jgi:uncharacterized membrane protein YhaH (DUF805 family)
MKEGKQLAKYANFNGCASRAEFWLWFVFTLIVTATLRVLSYNLGAVFSLRLSCRALL